MGMKKEGLKLFENGKRIDGRAYDELRPIKMEVGVLKRADGSCYLEWGGNKVLAAVYGPRECLPRHTQDPLKARINYRYNMAPFSTDERVRPGPSRRSIEISKLSKEALEHVIFTEYFPKTSIDIFVEILQADAGTRCAGLTAASLALADAGIPMKSLITACAAGKIDGKVVLDLGKLEDNFGEADLPIAYMPRTKELVYLQMDGDLTKDEFKEALRLALKGCDEIYRIQRDALKKAYEGEVNGR
ncbi:exosome complex exonuclease Rrp41 [Candidatus Micrarchaeota archaeon]|nr:MAG: exosome complex exonuclease Rrp41 [Candidatus Micrarchaeota archaeon]